MSILFLGILKVMNCFTVVINENHFYTYSVNIWNYGNIDDGGYSSSNIYFDDLFTGL